MLIYKSHTFITGSIKRRAESQKSTKHQTARQNQRMMIPKQIKQAVYNGTLAMLQEADHLSRAPLNHYFIILAIWWINFYKTIILHPQTSLVIDPRASVLESKIFFRL